MARILCTTGGLRGLLYSSLELCRRLVADGHDVSYASDPSVRGIVEAHGIDFQEIENDALASFLAEDRRRPWLQRQSDVDARRRTAVDALGIESFDALLDDLDSDLVLIDGEMHEHVIAAATHSSKPRVALLNTFVSIWKRPGLPPPHHRAVPGRGWKGTRLGMELLWLELRWRKWARRQRLWLRDLGCDRVSLLRSLARRREFAFREQVDFGQWLMPLTYRRLPCLTLHARETELPHEPPEHVRYVGPMIARERPETKPASRGRGDVSETFSRGCRRPAPASRRFGSSTRRSAPSSRRARASSRR